MSAYWTIQVMEDIEGMDWGDGFPSETQKDELKQLVITWRQGLQQALGLYELNWRRAREGSDTIKVCELEKSGSKHPIESRPVDSSGNFCDGGSR